MEKKIPLKNYIILVIIFIVFVLLVFYMRDWYNTTRAYYNENSPVLEVSTEMNQEELSNYAQENPDFILYVSSGYTDSIKSFERDFSNYIVQNNLNVVYIDASNIDINTFNDYLKNNFLDNSKLESKITSNQEVTVYDFSNSKITHIIDNIDDEDMDYIDKIFTRYEMIDNA